MIVFYRNDIVSYCNRAGIEKYEPVFPLRSVICTNFASSTTLYTILSSAILDLEDRRDEGVVRTIKSEKTKRWSAVSFAFVLTTRRG